jgi:hypothetical protein
MKRRTPPRWKIILGNLCIFFFSFSLITLTVFFLGNFQGFVKRAQFFLLDILKTSSFMCLMSGFSYLLYLALQLTRKKAVPRCANFLLASLSLCLGGFLLFFAHFIVAITRELT